MPNISKVSGSQRSLPTRGGWIEIRAVPENAKRSIVPPHTGRVD